MTTNDIFQATDFGRIHLRVTGDPSRQPLLLMHSASRSAYEFDDLASLLADRFYTVAWDMPGHGDSDRLSRHFSVSDYAAVARDLCNGLFNTTPIVGGGSIGAVIALAMAAEATVAGIVPIELPVGRNGAWWAKHWHIVEAMFGSPEEPIERLRTKFREVSPALENRSRVDRHKAGVSSMLDVQWAGREGADVVQDQIRSLSVPSLFINGDHGVATDAGDILPRLNPAAHLTIIENSGHFPHNDDPAAVARAILGVFGGEA